MPYCPVEDLKIHPRENELIVATHGRSIWIADISFFEELSSKTLAMKAFAFQPVDAVQWVSNSSYQTSSSNFSGQSRAPGVPLYYYINDGVSNVKVEMLDGDRVIYSASGINSRGVNILQWNFSRIMREKTEKEKEQAKNMAERMRSFGMTDAQIAERGGDPDYVIGRVGPGIYKFRITADGQVVEKTFRVLKDHWR